MNSNYIVVGVVAIVVGGAFAGVAWTHILPYREDVTNMEEVDAVVVSSGVIEGENAEGQATYEPNVTYQYTYKGTEYTSNSVFPGDVNPVSEESRARDIVNRYPAGKGVTAYVNAETPATAFLIDRQTPLWFWAGPAIGGLLILYGAYSIVSGLRGVDQSGEIG